MDDEILEKLLNAFSKSHICILYLQLVMIKAAGFKNKKTIPSYLSATPVMFTPCTPVLEH